MRRAFLAASLLFVLPCAAGAHVDPYSVMAGWRYADRCWSGSRHTLPPPIYELDATPDGILRWNGERADWPTFHAWLDQLSKSRRPDGASVSLGEKMPHRTEIIAILAKGGLTWRFCPPPKHPKFEPEQPHVY